MGVGMHGFEYAMIKKGLQRLQIENVETRDLAHRSFECEKHGMYLACKSYVDKCEALKAAQVACHEGAQALKNLESVREREEPKASDSEGEDED
jgi:hypothetical protein